MKRLLLSGVLCVVASSAVFAMSSDGYQQVTAYPSSVSGFYVGAEGGVELINGNLLGTSGASDQLDNGYNVGVHAGYDFGNSLRGELDYRYISNNVKTSGATNLSAYSSSVVMANALYGFELGKFHPYVGGGVGLVAPNWATGYFSYQGIASVEYRLSRKIGMDVNYHFVAMDVSNTPYYNLIDAGVNYYF